MKTNAKINVNLKTTFSKPRLVKEAEPPHPLAKPFPFVWIRMTAINKTPESN